MLDVCLLGTGGMMPLPNRYLTSLLVRYNGNSVLIDCGEGTQIAIKKKGWSVNPIGVICITHFHGDHVAGIPGLLLSIGNSGRTEPVIIVGPKGVERVVKSLCIIAPELPFETEFVEIEGDEDVFLFAGLRIEAFKLNHRIVCYGYNIVLERAGRFLPERAKENGVPLKYWNRLQKGETIELDGKIYTPDMVMGEERRGLKVTYCTDTRPVPVIAKKAEGADLFICEGMYGDPELNDKAVDKKHMTIAEACGLARIAEPKALWLTHYSPSMAHPEQYIQEAKKIFNKVKLGKDGKSIDLMFDED